MKFKFQHIRLISSLFAIAFSFGVFGQESGIKLVVQVKHQGSSYSEASIEIKKDQSFYDKTGTNQSGEFSYIFNYGAIYHIYFGGSGMATKCLELDLKEVPAREQKILHDWELGELSLFKTYEGIDLTVLEKPVGRIHYDAEIEDFTIDYKYGASREKQIHKLQKVVAAAQEVESLELKDLENAYSEFVKKGDDYYRDRNYEYALAFYRKARKLIPKNTKAPEKIVATNIEIEKNAKFKDLVLSGDELFKKEEWVLAKDQYKKASALKNSEPYPKSQLAAIAQKVKEQELLGNQFNNHMALADVAFANNNFVAAAEAYKKALAINSDAAMAKKNLSESEEVIAKQDATTNRKQKSQALLNEAKRAELQDDYNQAQQILEKALVMDGTHAGLLVEKKRVDDYLSAKKQKLEKEELAKKEAELLQAKNSEVKEKEFETWKNKGMAADKSGNVELAIYFFNKALAFNPNDDFIKSRLGTLKEKRANTKVAKTENPTEEKDENEFQALDKMDKKTNNFVALLAVKYPQGMTEKTYQEGNKKITKRIIVKGNLGAEYMKIEHSWGGVYYFKNGDVITEYVWQKEAK